jgi:hypothetical protein
MKNAVPILATLKILRIRIWMRKLSVVWRESKGSCKTGGLRMTSSSI